MKNDKILCYVFLFLIITTFQSKELFSQNNHKNGELKSEKITSLLPPFNENAVVKIIVYENFSVDKEQPGLYRAYPNLGHGSGVMIENGLILTAKHVIESARCIAVKIPGNNLTYPAEVVYKADYSDYAFIIIRGEHKNFVNLSQDPPLILRGQQIWAYGYPEIASEIEPNITKGTITRFSNTFNKWQFDAGIYGGNSGGPLVTDDGVICGLIVGSVKETDFLNFAVCIDTIITTYKNLKDLGTFIQEKKEFDELPTIQNKAKNYISNFFANNVIQGGFYIDLEKFESDINSIIDTNKFVKEWAIFKEIKASLFFNIAMYILEKNYKTVYTAKELKENDLKQYISYLNEAKQEVNIATRVDKNSRVLSKDR